MIYLVFLYKIEFYVFKHFINYGRQASNLSTKFTFFSDRVKTQLFSSFKNIQGEGWGEKKIYKERYICLFGRAELKYLVSNPEMKRYYYKRVNKNVHCSEVFDSLDGHWSYKHSIYPVVLIH